MTNVTFSQNSADAGDSGGVYVMGSPLRLGLPGIARGAGFYTDRPAIINSCSFISNSATSGRYGTTIYRASSYGAGLSATNALLRNSLFQGNVASTNIEADGVISAGYNLFSTSVGITNFTTTDILNQDAKVSPLRDNGGATWTHALLAGSPAIDHGDAADVRTDQRGFPRPLNYANVPDAFAGDDIGAFESDPLPRFAGIFISGTTINLRCSTRSDATYRLETKTNLHDAWHPLFTFPGNGGVVSQLVGAGSGNQRFFRIVQQP